MNLYILRSDYPRTVQKSNYCITHKQCRYLVHSSKNYYKILNMQKLRFTVTRVINIVTHRFERTSHMLLLSTAKENKKAAGE